MQDAETWCLLELELELELLAVSSPPRMPDARPSLELVLTPEDANYSASLSRACIQSVVKLLLLPEEARQQKALQAHQLLQQARTRSADASYQHLLGQVLILLRTQLAFNPLDGHASGSICKPLGQPACGCFNPEMPHKCMPDALLIVGQQSLPAGMRMDECPECHDMSLQGTSTPCRQPEMGYALLQVME